MKQKIMLIGIGWEQLPLLKKANNMGLETIALIFWKSEQIKADKIYKINSRDLVKIEEIFLIEKPDYILADECDYSMYAVAYLTDKYGLPGPGLKPLTIANNKFLQRKTIDAIEVKQPKFMLCWNYDMLLNATELFNYPLVIKPLDNRGSIGVSIVKNEVELKSAWFTAISNSHSRLCLAEEYIGGDIITFEGFYDSLGFNFLSISTKENYQGTTIVAKKLYYPGKIKDKKLINKLISDSKQIIKAIEMKYGFAHIEFIIEKKSQTPYFIEIANRGGGVHISNLILPEITGIDLNEKYIKLAMGQHVDINWNGYYKSKVLMYFLIPRGTNTPQKIIEKYNENLLAFYIKPYDAENGKKKNDALGRIGVAIIKGKSFKDLEKIGYDIENDLDSVKNEFYWSRN